MILLYCAGFFVFVASFAVPRKEQLYMVNLKIYNCILFTDVSTHKIISTLFKIRSASALFLNIFKISQISAWIFQLGATRLVGYLSSHIQRRAHGIIAMTQFLIRSVVLAF